MELRDAIEADLGALVSIYNEHMMIAAVDATNAPSIRFHERLGFHPVGCLREVGHKFDRWLDLVFLQRRLGA
jgi:L-amino acid N-acyltransferase